MYCKHLIYSGANEMSFEELRAIKYNARREAKKLEGGVIVVMIDYSNIQLHGHHVLVVAMLLGLKSVQLFSLVSGHFNYS